MQEVANYIFKGAVTIYALFFSAKTAICWYKFKPKHVWQRFWYNLDSAATILGLLIFGGLILAL